MELNLFEDRRYFVTWTGEELEGRGKARLVFQPVQCMGGGPARPGGGDGAACTGLAAAVGQRGWPRLYLCRI